MSREYPCLQICIRDSRRSHLNIVALLACIFALSAASPLAAATSCAVDAGWNDPAEPRQIHGNTWYVGTCGISAILVASPQGHILIDGATEQAAPRIESNIRAAGFDIKEVRYLLNSHEHLDHAGGIAQLQRDSGATVVAREPAASILERGSSDRNDPQFLSLDPFPPVLAVQRIEPGASVTLGVNKLTAHATPGHTQGSTTWTWTSCAGNRCLSIVYADSLTAISDDGYRYSDDASHPGVLAAFRESIATVGKLSCDILITPHPGASSLWSRLGPQATAPQVDPGACNRYAQAAAATLDARVVKERTGPNP